MKKETLGMIKDFTEMMEGLGYIRDIENDTNKEGVLNERNISFYKERHPANTKQRRISGRTVRIIATDPYVYIGSHYVDDIEMVRGVLQFCLDHAIFCTIDRADALRIELDDLAKQFDYHLYVDRKAHHNLWVRPSKRNKEMMNDDV